MILGASGPFAGLGGGELIDDLVDLIGVALDRPGDRPATERTKPVTLPVPARAREIHPRDRNTFALDIKPDVALGPIEQGLDADMLARGATGGELVPEFRRLVLVIPLEIFGARTEVAFLRPRRIFIPADPGDQGVPFVLRHDLLQRDGFELVSDGHR